MAGDQRAKKIIASKWSKKCEAELLSLLLVDLRSIKTLQYSRWQYAPLKLVFQEKDGEKGRFSSPYFGPPRLLSPHVSSSPLTS